MKIRNFLVAVVLGICMMLMSTGPVQAGSYVDDVKLATQDPNVILTVYIGMSARDLEANFAGAKEWKLVEKQRNYRISNSEQIPLTVYHFVKGNVGKDIVCEAFQVNVRDDAGVELVNIGFYTNYRSAAADIKERLFNALVGYHGHAEWGHSEISSFVKWKHSEREISMYVMDKNKSKDNRSRLDKERWANPGTHYMYWVQYGLKIPEN